MRFEIDEFDGDNHRVLIWEQQLIIHHGVGIVNGLFRSTGTVRDT